MSTNSQPTPTPDPQFVAEQVNTVIDALITETPLERFATDASTATMTRSMGALVRFEGVVRDHDGGQAVRSLTYESHPSAQDELRAIVEDIAKHHPVRIWAAHRVGPVPIGEMAFLVLVAGAHRSEAFAACEEVTDRVKSQVPIWKEQSMSDGATQWVGIDDAR
ncbi:molybdenum cofactor biosynthesis protein MoaE [Corynebacterium sp. NML130628]|uniref:molybdenum cofactor biosynthesis protein MoaE n=1 Tax=Corynebacterium sp. NML130628 TaxID=1906333 RepID=UPI0008FAEE0F|nr:molybdenum cofactor biosynthesis protein MoaE [Corynebacterium sp. NML130628]OIR46376.1 molybdopterin converting factor [Corynebacterium sp. NML130628]